MDIRRYSWEKKECKNCGCLLPPKITEILAHTCSPYVTARKIQEAYSIPKLETKYKVGDEVEVSKICTIQAIVGTNGEVKYLTDGWFKESEVYPLRKEVEK